MIKKFLYIYLIMFLSIFCSLSSAKPLVISSTEINRLHKSTGLIVGNWAPVNYIALAQLIEKHGKNSINYNLKKKPYAVFDWDNTSQIMDIGEHVMQYQLENLVFKMTPAEFDSALKQGVPKDAFPEGFSNLDGKTVNIDILSEDIIKSYTVLYNSYLGLNGTKSLNEVQQLPEYKDFITKVWFAYEAVNGFGYDVGYPWLLYLYKNFNTPQLEALVMDSQDQALKEKLEYKIWTSPASLSGKSGTYSVKIKKGIRFTTEVQNLYRTLVKNGIDVYVVSAAALEPVRLVASNPKYGYSVPSDRIFGMILAKDANEIFQSFLNPNYAQTQRAGKTTWIKKYIAPKYGDKGPILVAGDSGGDVNMLTDFENTGISLIFNLSKTKTNSIGELYIKALSELNDPNKRYLSQGVDQNKGTLRSSNYSILLGKNTENKI